MPGSSDDVPGAPGEHETSGSGENLLLFQRLKYEKFLLELELPDNVDDVSLDAVESAVQSVVDSYPCSQRMNSHEEDNLHELRGLMVEFWNWKSCDHPQMRQNMLLAKFRGLLFQVGCTKDTCKGVSLFALDVKMTNLETGCNVNRYLSCLKCCFRELTTWRFTTHICVFKCM